MATVTVTFLFTLQLRYWKQEESPLCYCSIKAQQHMELGVDLGTAPTEARVQVFSVNVQNVSYYIAEATGNQWRDGWRVGETPSEYQNVSSQVVPLRNMEQSSIGQVSASLRELDPKHHRTTSFSVHNAREQQRNYQRPNLPTNSKRERYAAS